MKTDLPHQGVRDSILHRIADERRRDLEQSRKRADLEALRQRAECADPVRDLVRALNRRRPAVIAEYKRASPSRGMIREDRSPRSAAAVYEAAGAAALSVLTEPRHFGGRLEHLSEARRAVKIPVLRKDFLVDPFQVYESRAAGADAFLLIAALFSTQGLHDMVDLGRRLGMAALVEVHDEPELRRALEAGAEVVGINNRCLHTLTVSLDTTLRLAPKIPPEKTVVSESGIRSGKDIAGLTEAGVHAFLVGTVLMEAPDPDRKLRELLGME